MSRWRVRSSGTIAAVAGVVGLSACGGGANQAASEPSGNFTVDVPTATFPASQRLAEHTHLKIAVRNAGNKTIPNVAVTITAPSTGTAAQAFGDLLSATGSSQGLASRSRPVWVVDRPPGPCQYSCSSGGPGGAVTAYSNTWALGSLRPGATATFEWGVTPIKAGRYVIEYQVAAGLSGKAKAVLSGGEAPKGRFNITIHSAPQPAYVNDQGQVIKTQ